jgi:hypothetical protein
MQLYDINIKRNEIVRFYILLYTDKEYYLILILYSYKTDPT